MEIIDQLKITCKHGFNYTVVVKHHPVIGMSVAYFDDRHIARREYGRFQPPFGDNDLEWEQWHQRFAEYVGGPLSDLERMCKYYFDNQ